ncbi:MAG TPA: BtrH N-terminal domain-containing protein [Bacteroidia bacterium]|nr:BtrH N-terminal domain-containing protein [Bacteroidia bacterium]
MEINFKHVQAAHCENGVTTNLLRHIGVNKITEPLAFGIGSGIFFIYIPLLMINNGPAFSYRTMPGLIFKRTCKSLGVPVIRKKFSSTEKAQQYLDACLESDQPVGCQVGVYYLTYFPKEYRFHFNAHNIVVFGKEEDKYLISDPVMEGVTTLTGYELQRVRFAKGALAPRGQLYYPELKNEVSDDMIRHAIVKGIKRNIRDMLHIPGPIAGIRGIRYTGKKIIKWRDKLGVKKAGLYLAQLVRMQEEIGTGGGGFRFIYAAFLQQAYTFHKTDELLKISEQFTKAGDLWRSSAVQAAGIFKGRITSQQDFNDMGNYLFEVAETEKQAFIALSKIKWK